MRSGMWGLLLLAGGLVLAAGGGSYGRPPARIPAAFWQHLPPSHLVDWRHLFLDQPGSRRCSIVSGALVRGPMPLMIAGRCTTALQAVQPADLPAVPASSRSAAWRAVTLTETWGKGQQGVWHFVIDRQGDILGQSTSGQFPQFWK